MHIGPDKAKLSVQTVMVHIVSSPRTIINHNQPILSNSSYVINSDVRTSPPVMLIKWTATLVICLLLLSNAAIAQYKRHIVKLKDKQGSSYSIGQAASFLSQRAIDRRRKQNISLTENDLPVSQSYINSVAAIPGVTVINHSKWLNQLLVRVTDDSLLETIGRLPFVATTKPVASQSAPSGNEPQLKKFDNGVVDVQRQRELSGTFQQTGTNDTLNYGNSENQIKIHQGEFLHNLGFRGQGVQIAVFDAGFFGYKTNPAFDSVRLQNRIIAEYDFVANETSVNEDNIHGMQCLSVIAANRPGVLVGSAPSANFFLLRTEDAASEYPIEEQYWAVAAEYADSAGADIISSSLGYANFNDPSFNYEYEERDGNTSMVTIAADLAASKGIIVVNSAGNSGAQTSDLKFVSCPADGDSVLAVGSVTANGTISSFSSWGPTPDGRIKPNVVSIGTGTIIANTSGNAASGNGTSFANPNIAGLVACLWQAFPEFNNMQILDAVQKSSSRYNNPDSRFGYGIPNFRIAYELLDQQRKIRLQDILKDDWFKPIPTIFTSSVSVGLRAPSTGRATINMFDVSGRLIVQKTVDVQSDAFYNVTLYPPAIASGIYYLQYNDGKNKKLVEVIRR
jgi:serine protease AprX